MLAYDYGTEMRGWEYVQEIRRLHQFSLFDDAENVEKMEKEKKLQKALVSLKKKYGKNSILKGTNYLDGATMRERNQQIGGHRSG